MAPYNAEGSKRFEHLIGASPAVLPAGTHTVHIHAQGVGGGGRPSERWTGDILISDLAAADLDFNLDAHNPEAASRDVQDTNNVIVRMRYAAASGQLTYSILNTGKFALVRMVAIGEG